MDASGESEEAPPSPVGTNASRLQAAVAELTRRSQEILDTAERKAAELLSEAGAEAEAVRQGSRSEAERRAGQRREQDRVAFEQMVAATRAAEAVHSLVAGVQEQLQRTAVALADTTAELERSVELMKGLALARSEQDEEVEVKAPPAQPGPAAGEVSALQRATLLALAGRSREQIARTLRDDYDIEDPNVILDEALGPDTR